MLPDRKRTDKGWEPRAPLILGGWNETSDDEKRERLAEHIHWADSHDYLQELAKFLKELPEDDWHHIDGIALGENMLDSVEFNNELEKLSNKIINLDSNFDDALKELQRNIEERVAYYRCQRMETAELISNSLRSIYDSINDKETGIESMDNLFSGLKVVLSRLEEEEHDKDREITALIMNFSDCIREINRESQPDRELLAYVMLDLLKRIGIPEEYLGIGPDVILRR